MVENKSEEWQVKSHIKLNAKYELDNSVNRSM